jgi:hypothetical protein
MQAHLFKLDGQSFLDLFTAETKDIQPPPIPAHCLLRAQVSTSTIGLTPLDYEWLNNWLAKNPKDLRHHIIRAGKNSDDTRLVLTADTAELQRFIVKHLKTEDAWKEGLELKRDAPTASR